MLIREPERIPCFAGFVRNSNRPRELRQVTRVPKQTSTSSTPTNVRSAHDALVGLKNAHPRLRLEQRLLRSKDGSGLWWAQLSSEIVVVVMGGSPMSCWD
jgi:hypothetical protein